MLDIKILQTTKNNHKYLQKIQSRNSNKYHFFYHLCAYEKLITRQKHSSFINVSDQGCPRLANEELSAIKKAIKNKAFRIPFRHKDMYQYIQN